MAKSQCMRAANSKRASSLRRISMWRWSRARGSATFSLFHSTEIIIPQHSAEVFVCRVRFVMFSYITIQPTYILRFIWNTLKSVLVDIPSSVGRRSAEFCERSCPVRSDSIFQFIYSLMAIVSKAVVCFSSFWTWWQTVFFDEIAPFFEIDINNIFVDPNIVQGRQVFINDTTPCSLNGGNCSSARLEMVTDGAFFNEADYFGDTLWWKGGQDVNPEFYIALSNVSRIYALQVQADCANTIHLEYRYVLPSIFNLEVRDHFKIDVHGHISTGRNEGEERMWMSPGDCENLN